MHRVGDQFGDLALGADPAGSIDHRTRDGGKRHACAQHRIGQPVRSLEVDLSGAPYLTRVRDENVQIAVRGGAPPDAVPPVRLEPGEHRARPPVQQRGGEELIRRGCSRPHQHDAGKQALPALAAALDRALTRPDPVRRAAGRELAARYTWSAAAARHLAFYRALLRR